MEKGVESNKIQQNPTEPSRAFDKQSDYVQRILLENHV